MVLRALAHLRCMSIMRKHAFYTRGLERRDRKTVAHPATRTDDDSGWWFTCQLRGCTARFESPMKQRRYCTDEHRIEAANLARRRRAALHDLHSLKCARHDCKERFVPKRVTKKYCSKKCAQRARRYANAPLDAHSCAWCSAPLPDEAGLRMKYCSAAHRVAAHRARKAAL